MGRNVLIAMLMIGLSVPLYFGMNTMMTTFNNPRLNVKDATGSGADNWILTINTTITQLNQNCSLL